MRGCRETKGTHYFTENASIFSPFQIRKGLSFWDILSQLQLTRLAAEQSIWFAAPGKERNTINNVS